MLQPVPTMTQSVLKPEFDYYLAHQDELVKQYDGKILAIKGHAVIGAFDDHVTALTEVTKKFPMGTFLLQRCSPGTADYTRTFHSRVAIA